MCVFLLTEEANTLELRESTSYICYVGVLNRPLLFWNSLKVEEHVTYRELRLNVSLEVGPIKTFLKHSLKSAL